MRGSCLTWLELAFGLGCVGPLLLCLGLALLDVDVLEYLACVRRGMRLLVRLFVVVRHAQLLDIILICRV